MPVIVGDGSGDSKMQGDGKGVSVGSTNTTGRNAGVSTATGTLIFNETDGEVQVYTGNTDGWANVSASAFSASGGTTVEFQEMDIVSYFYRTKLR